MSNFARHAAPSLETRLPVLGALFVGAVELTGIGARYLRRKYLEGCMRIADLISEHRVGVLAAVGGTALAGGITSMGYELIQTVEDVPAAFANGIAGTNADVAVKPVDGTAMAAGGILVAGGAGLIVSAGVTHDMRHSAATQEIDHGLALFE